MTPRPARGAGGEAVAPSGHRAAAGAARRVGPVGLRAIGLAVCIGALAVGCGRYQDGASWSGYAADRERAGGLRTDRDAPDMPFDADDLARNFVTVALGAEANPVGPQPGERALASGILRRWQAPIRWVLADDSATAARDAPVVERTFARLATLTGLDIAEAGDETPNLFVFLLRPQDYESVAATPPDWPSGRWLAGFIERFGRAPGTPCVATFSATREGAAEGPHRIGFAVVLIRAELPTRLAEACIEEELAQTMGLPNDDPAVRPSIFNDDQEFALMTRHDELLMRMLYDPRLEPGMTRAEVESMIPDIASDILQAR